MADRKRLLEVLEKTQSMATPENRRVVCAANRWPDGMVILGVRHYCPTMLLTMESLGYLISQDPNKGHPEQGFIDNFGNFLTREQAFLVAKEKGQILPDSRTNDGFLYSENLY